MRIRAPFWRGSRAIRISTLVFFAFTGVTPLAYLRAAPREANHLPMDLRRAGGKVTSSIPGRSSRRQLTLRNH